MQNKSLKCPRDDCKCQLLFNDRFICLFVLYPHLPHRVNSQKRTYREIPYHPVHSSSLDLISFHVSCPLILLSCILHQVRTLPCLPVLYIYPDQVSVLSLNCLHVVHINISPHKYESLNSSEIPLTVLVYYVWHNFANSMTLKHLPSCTLHAYLFQRPWLTKVAPFLFVV